MAVYKMVPDTDKYHRLVLGESGQRIVNRFLGRSLKKRWKPLSVSIYKSKKWGDFPRLESHVPVFSDKALKILEPLIADSIEALPLISDSKRFFAVHVLDLVDCLDYERSEVKRFPEGNIMRIGWYVFKKGCIDGKHIFRIREAPLKDVLVSEEFKRVVEESKLEGVDFDKVG
jgi:hypothetical protein